jgi:putative spermidine/putrescine transport system substrate-binding protein
MRRGLVLAAVGIFFLYGLALAGETITLCSYGGSYNKAIEEVFGNPFTKETGIEVILTSFPNYAKMKAQVESGNIEWDVVEPSVRAFTLGAKDGLFEPLDLTGIPEKDFAKGGVHKFGLATIYYSHNVTYRTDVWPEGTGPKSWKDIFDTKKFPGPRGFKYTAYSNLEIALLADGVPHDKIYPLDVDRALKKLDEIKPLIKVFWKNGSNAQQVMLAHEVDCGSFPGGRMFIIADKGTPVACEWDGQILDLDYFCILKGSKHKQAALRFIRYTADPKRQAAFAEKTYYGPSNLKAYDFIPLEKAKKFPTYPGNMKTAVFIDGDWYAKHGKEVESKWEAWKLK